MPDMSNAVLITVIGMGLVFGAIVLLWLLLWALVRFTGDTTDVPTPAAGDAAPGDEAVVSPAALSPVELLALKQRAAAVAVAIALAQHNRQGRPVVPPMRLVSAWQIVMRTHQYGERISRGRPQ